MYDLFGHPLEDNRAFVRQNYRDFLGREADRAGLAFWEPKLNNGSAGRTDLVEAFLNSPEFGGTIAPVARLYEAYFGRPPDREGLRFWSQMLRSGQSLE